MKAVQEHYRMILVTKTKGFTEGDSKYAKIPFHHSASIFFKQLYENIENCSHCDKYVYYLV